MSAHRRAPRPYRAGHRPVARRFEVVELSVKPHSERPEPAPGEPGGPGRTVDLAFNPAEPRDPLTGKWTFVSKVVGSRHQIDAYEGSERIGRIVVSGHGWERPEIGGIYVKPEHRRKGVASALLAEAQKHEAHKIQHSRNLTYDGDQFARHFEPDMEERYTFEPDLVMSLSCAETTEIVDLANPSLRRTRYVTGQLLDGKDPATLLHHRGISREVAEAVAALAGKGTAVRPNARRRGMPLSLGMRIERDREALYRGAYLLKAAERVQASVDAGKSLREALNVESPYYVAHEKARRGRLDAVTEAHRVAMRLGTVVQTPEGTTRTLLGWYLDPLLKNDPECVAANGHNYYAEEGTVIGYPGAVHLNCGCKSGPPIEGAGMVNDAVRGVVTLGLVSKKPAYPLSRKRKTA